MHARTHARTHMSGVAPPSCMFGWFTCGDAAHAMRAIFRSTHLHCTPARDLGGITSGTKYGRDHSGRTSVKKDGTIHSHSAHPGHTAVSRTPARARVASLSWVQSRQPRRRTHSDDSGGGGGGDAPLVCAEKAPHREARRIVPRQGREEKLHHRLVAQACGPHQRRAAPLVVEAQRRARLLWVRRSSSVVSRPRRSIGG